MNPPVPAAQPGIPVNCPACGEKTFFGPGNAFRPFCSKRCQSQDFGAWASESYKVSAPPEADDSAS